MNITNATNAIKSPVMATGSTEQATSFLLILITCMVSGLCFHLLKSFWCSRKEQLYNKPLRPRRPIHLIISYILIILSLFVETISLMCLYWINVNTSNTLIDRTPIYFTEEVDYFLHILFWILFISFIHLKLHGLILQMHECDHGYYSPRHNDYKHFFQYKNSCQRFGYIFIILSIISIIGIQIAIHSAINEQIFLLIVAIFSFIFINWYFWKYFDEDIDTIYFKEQWNKIWWLFCIGLIVWFMVFVIWITYNDMNYLSFKLCIILLYSTWIGLFCYIETKWILNKIFSKQSININNYSNDNILNKQNNNTNVIEEDDKVIHDILMDSIDTADGGENTCNEIKVNNNKELSLIIENRKKQLQKQKTVTKYGDEIFGIEKIEKKKSESERKSDSEELYDNKNEKRKKPTRKTPKHIRKTPIPPPKVGEKWNKLINNIGLMDEKSDSEDMYQNNNQIITTKKTKRKDSSSSDSDELYQNKGYNSMSNVKTKITPDMITEKKHQNVDNNPSENIVIKQITVEGEDDGAV
eukprot:450_1